MASSYEENKNLRARVRRLEEQASQKREVSTKEVEELHRDATAAPRKEAESLRKGEYLICRVFSTIPSGSCG
jgi:cell division septum initiation protein DivIVA